MYKGAKLKSGWPKPSINTGQENRERPAQRRGQQGLSTMSCDMRERMHHQPDSELRPLLPCHFKFMPSNLYRDSLTHAALSIRSSLVPRATDAHVSAYEVLALHLFFGTVMFSLRTLILIWKEFVITTYKQAVCFLNTRWSSLLFWYWAYFLWHLLGIDILKMGGNILTNFELGEETASWPTDDLIRSMMLCRPFLDAPALCFTLACWRT